MLDPRAGAVPPQASPSQASPATGRSANGGAPDEAPWQRLIALCSVPEASMNPARSRRAAAGVKPRRVP
jgi:hypothetical protein